MHYFKILPLLTGLLSLASCTSSVELPTGTSRGYSSARFVQTSARDRNAAPEALEREPAFNAAVKRSISRAFDANGVPMTQGSADLIVAYMLIRQNSASTTMNSDYFGRGRNPMAILEEAHKRGVIKNTSPDASLKGAIVIDVLDAKTNKLVFRNFAVRPVLANANAATRQNRLNAAVSEALAPFFKR